MFRKLLIANRGEIAVRIIRTAKKLGIRTVAVYAEDDRKSLHVSLADEAFLLPGTLPSENYLDQDLIIDLALRSGAEAIHPGYGFLSENGSFAEKVEQAGLTFIGPTPEQINLMGDKIRAIDYVSSLNVPVITGKRGKAEKLLEESYEFPVMIKASSGGGGKGMQLVWQTDDLPLAIDRAQRQAEKYFGNGTLFIEKYLPDARHIEVQVMGDGKGDAVHLFERECSTQRKYQKLIEESPALSLSVGVKEKLYDYALRIAKAVHYRGAGTIEFLVDQHENCYFLEMNTRLQVEHPVTECITRQDLVLWQLQVAAGMGLPLKQKEIKQTGHAIELRICAEDPGAGFIPSCGTVGALTIPASVRWDSFITAGTKIPAAYDSLIGKLVVHDRSRGEALEKLTIALQKLLVTGVKTNQLFLLNVIRSETFRTNKMTACFLEGQVNDLLYLSDDARKNIPVEMIFASYLAGRYCRPLERKDLWFNAGHWRSQTALYVDVDNISYHFDVLRSGNKSYLRYQNKWSELSDVDFDGNTIIFKLDDHFYEVMVYDEQDTTVVQYQAHQFRIGKSCFVDRSRRRKYSDKSDIPSQIVAGLFGKVVDVFIEPGDQLFKGQNLLIIESMKMEFTIQSPVDATVKAVHVSKGKMVQDTEILVDLES
ncbi:MAG: acetyl/propionyl/methylcrotonyl-CoA carboxylase subunit alpha [Mangrovibacterium sp.]